MPQIHLLLRLVSGSAFISSCLALMHEVHICFNFHSINCCADRYRIQSRNLPRIVRKQVRHMENHYHLIAGAGAAWLMCGRCLIIEWYNVQVLEDLQRKKGRSFSYSLADNGCNRCLDVLSTAYTGNGETSAFLLLLFLYGETNYFHNTREILRFF